MTIVDLPALAALALEQIDRTRPPDAHIVHRNRIKLATHALADQDPGAYFNEIMDAVEAAAGPCPCGRCPTEAP